MAYAAGGSVARRLPNALFVIFGGIRTALAICVGSRPGLSDRRGGLGELIFTGIRWTNSR